MLGSLKGFDGSVNIVEGTTEDIISLKKNKGQIKLDFQIRCDKFQKSLYENGTPKEYKSDLTIIENGKEVLKKSIVVNDPLRYKGINIFQSNYGISFDSAPRNKLLLEFTCKDSGVSHQKEASVENEIDIPDNHGKFILKGYVPSYNFREHNIGATYTGMITKPDGSTRSVILPVKYEVFDKMFKPDVSVAIVKPYFTGLQITKDPGVYFVYTGFILMILGCYIAFFTSHKSLCLEVTPKENNQHGVMLSGTANKNKIGMRMKVGKIALFIKKS